MVSSMHDITAYPINQLEEIRKIPFFLFCYKFPHIHYSIIHTDAAQTSSFSSFNKTTMTVHIHDTAPQNLKYTQPYAFLSLFSDIFSV